MSHAPQPKAKVHVAGDLDVTDGQSTGNFKADLWIKIVQKLGFPIAVASAALWILSGLIADYRDNVKASTGASIENSRSMATISRAMESISGTIERLDDSFSTFEGNQTKTHEILETNQQVLEGVKTEQKRTNDLLEKMVIKP